MDVLLDFEGEKGTSDMQLHVGRQLLDLVPFQSNLEQMLRDLMEEAGTWDLVLNPASLWWTSTYEPEERCDLSIDTKFGRYKFPFEAEFKILGCAMNRRGRTQDALEERIAICEQVSLERYFDFQQ